MGEWLVGREVGGYVAVKGAERTYLCGSLQAIYQFLGELYRCVGGEDVLR